MFEVRRVISFTPARPLDSVSLNGGDVSFEKLFPSEMAKMVT